MNPKLDEQELEQAKEQWQESEWRLNFLRTTAGTPIPEPTEEEILLWYKNQS